MCLVDIACPGDYKRVGAGCYSFHTSNPTYFDDAITECENEGGRVAIVKSLEQILELRNSGYISWSEVSEYQSGN